MKHTDIEHVVSNSDSRSLKKANKLCTLIQMGEKTGAEQSAMSELADYIIFKL